MEEQESFLFCVNIADSPATVASAFIIILFILMDKGECTHITNKLQLTTSDMRQISFPIFMKLDWRLICSAL